MDGQGTQGFRQRGIGCGMAVAASMTALAALTWTMVTPDRLLSRSFEQAIAGHPTTPSVATAGRSDREGLWLSRLESEPPAGLAQGVAIGDRISLQGGDGRMTEFAVVDVRPITADPARSRTVAGPRIDIVTARSTSEASPRTIRFIIETDENEPAPAPLKPQRTL